MSSIELVGEIAEYQIGQPRAVWSARGDRILRYSIDIRHKSLHLHREISAPELFILEAKANALIANWDEKNQSLKFKRLFQNGQAAASDATTDAQLRIQGLSRLLGHTLTVNDAVDWDSLKDLDPYPRPKEFPEPAPVKSLHPTPGFVPAQIGFLDLILGRKRALIEQAETRHRHALEESERRSLEAEARFNREFETWKARENDFWKEQDKLEKAHLAEQSERNSFVDALKQGVETGDPVSVVEHATLVLENSDYNGLFEKSFKIQYDRSQRLLKIEYRVPNQDELPNTKSVKYDKNTGELLETKIAEREARSNFEQVSFQISLRTIHELFEADEWGNIERVLFNGVVDFVDKRTGREQSACVMSLLADRQSFQSIDLSRVDPKACFKSLKGISAASLASLTAIAPVMEMDREDARFVDAKAVVAELEPTQNLASMSWEDFEHLVRELFEKEFASRGGEVRITQASRDGGVDAIAFDPDPITGGKIVIQAKRYTRTVGVSAVRDLFGTVMNEGASKGILVTTADYGPDAHQFATGKPLALLSGSHLLHMLDRHGFKAKIDLKEAREQAFRA